MKILVTGAAGFIGSHFCEKILAVPGTELFGIDNFDPFYERSVKEQNLKNLLKKENFSFSELDLLELKKDTNPFGKTPDLVVHLAAKAGVQPSLKDPGGYIQNNIVGTFNLLEWMNFHGVKKLVFGSSSSIYGNHPDIPFKESMNVSKPISPYAFTKASNELMTFNYHHLYELDSINLRFFTVIGPRQRPDLAIHKFFNLIRDSQPIPLFGDGSSARDYTYVGDIVEGIVSATQVLQNTKRMYEVINLGNHSPISLEEMVSVIEKVSDKKLIRKYLPMQAGDVNITFADISKARQILNYNPQTSFEDGVREFYRWYKGRE